MDNYFNYFTEVEEHFIRKRQKHLLVPPLDWCLIELWKESGIPIHVVIRGIDRSFETARSRRTSPRSLSYCHPAVTQAFEEHQRAMVGSGEEASEPTDFQGRGVDSARILEHVDRLSASLRARPEDFDGPLSLLSSLRTEVGAREQLDGRQIDQDLNHIGVLVAEVLRDEMDRKRLRSLRERSQEGDEDLQEAPLAGAVPTHAGELYPSQVERVGSDPPNSACSPMQLGETP